MLGPHPFLRVLKGKQIGIMEDGEINVEECVLSPPSTHTPPAESDRGKE